MPALRRLRALAPLSDGAVAAIVAGAAHARSLGARRELLTEGEPIHEPLLLLEGWAARVRILHDGRRQFIGFVLPGEIIGHRDFADALASSTVVALTDVRFCTLPGNDAYPDLARATAIGRALDEAYLTAQITRLGRFEARERILDLFLELHERLSLAGMTDAGSFVLPLTQEILADALGLTSVHVNRTIQVVRRSGDLIWSGRRLTLLDPAASSSAIGRTAPRVARDPHPAVNWG